MSGPDDWFERQQRTAVRRPAGWWLTAARYGRLLVGPFCRLQVTGTVPEALRRGPVLLAPNHIGNFDAFALAVAVREVGLDPRFLVTAGIMGAPVVGPLMEKAGNLRVNRGRADAARSMELVDLALAHGAHLVIYPEGRVSLDPDLWPERGKTGLARIALKNGVPVVPVAQWGAHEVMKYEDNRAMLTSLASSVWRQPAAKVHFGDPVPLEDLQADRPGDAVKAHRRIMAALTRDVRRLRGKELGPPRYLDQTRPIAARPTAAFPGGVVPDDLP